MHASSRNSLWTLAHAPLVWSAHFLLCYLSAAWVCRKPDDAAGFDHLRIAIAFYTITAVVLIAAHALRCLRRAGRALDARARAGHAQPVETSDRFLAIAGLLLALPAIIAVMLGALPALYFGDCR